MKKLSKILSVGLSLAMCASMVTPGFAASFTELQGAINTGNSVYQDDGETYKIEASKDDTGAVKVTLHEKVTNAEGGAVQVNVNQQTVTIDLNGNSIVDEKSKNQAIYVYGANASLTVTDSSEKQTGTIEGVGTKVIMNQGGTLNLKSGTVKADGTGAQRAVYVQGGTVNISEDAIVIGGNDIICNDQGQITDYDVGVYVQSGTVNTKGSIEGHVGVYTKGETSTVNVTGGTIEGDSYGIRALRNGVANVTGGSVTGGTDGIRLESGAKATIDGKGVEISGNNGVAVMKETTLIVKNGKISGTNSGITGNGTKEDGQRWYGDTTITISGGEVTGGLTGIYHPQFGTLNISGGSISGLTGVEMRAGTLNISGGKVTGNYIYDGHDYAFGAQHFGGSGTTLGVGVAVSQHVTDEQIVVNISGGTLEGYYALFEKDLANAYKDGDIKLNITGGKLVSTVHENAKADTNRVNNVTTPEYSTNDAVKVMDDYKFFATGGMSTDKIAEDYLGYLTEAEMAKFPYNNKKTDGKVSCIEVIPQDDELLFQVGYLTAENPSEDGMTLNVGGKDTLKPQLYLSGRPVSVKELSKVVAENGWSYDKNVVTIDKNGGVAAVAAGTTEVTITLINGETVTFSITVSAITPPTTEIPNVDVPLGELPGDTTEIEDEAVPLAGLFTRADAIGYLWEQSGSPEWELSDFEDVPEDHQWAVAIGWAQDMGIAVADLDGNFRPDDLVLRFVEDLEIDPEGEFEEFLNRYAVYAGIKLDEGELFIELGSEWDDIVMGEDAQVIFDSFFAKLETALAEQAA